MDSSGFSSPRNDCFPAGLRVLVVDDDPTWLKILEKMLKKCNYEVTTCNLAREALSLLRERKDRYDIVISDVNMPDMDGFKLLEHVGLEMDLPVIMMSVDGETSRVMKGVQHGACDYLLKPIRMKELRNIWQHVFRKRIHEVRDIEGHESLEEIQMMRSGIDQPDDGYLYGGDLISGKKRKDADNKHDDRVCGDPSSLKKARVVWTVDLHQKFVKAVNQIGFEKVGPKKILDLMGVPWLTRENVASHLQKYRLYLSRLQKENELKATFGGAKHSDISSKESTGNVCLQNPIPQNSAANVQQNVLPNETYSVEGNVKGGILSMPNIESKKSLFGETSDLAKCSTSRINFNHSFRPLDSDVKPEPKNPMQYAWSAEAPPLQFKPEHKPHFQKEPTYNHQLPLPGYDPVGPSLARNPGPSSKESDKPPQGIKKVTKVKHTAALFSVQPEIDPIQNLQHNLFDDLEPTQRTLNTGSALRLWDDQELYNLSSQGDFCTPNACFGNIEPFGFGLVNQELVTSVPPHLFDAEWSDPVEYPVIGQGLYIA